MFGTVNARMKYPKNFLTCYLLFLCTLFNRSQAQILGTHTQFAPNADRTNRLSPQQQGQILSDIQQHQHRFDLSQNRQNFEPQHFQANQNLQQAQRFQQFLNQQQFVSQSPVQLSTQENFAQNEFLSSLPLLKSIPSNVVPTPQHTFQQISTPTVQTPSSQVVFPNQQPTDSAKILQHHTQTNFQPARQHISFGPQFIQPRPTSDPLALIDQQIKLLDPEKHKQKIKELKEKQGIIEKHNQFVEKQYDKALKKAQEDHQEFIDRQRNQKKQLYQRLYKTTGSEPIHLAQSAPRFLYPEEVGLFEQAVKQYYNEHPTTTTTTTTTPKPTTPKKVSLSIKAPSFLPTALPQSKLKTIQSLEDLDQLQKEYKSQRIRKDDLLEQLKLAIGRGQEDEIGKALSSREISLSNGKKIQFISADDRTKLPKGKEEEITLPDGKKVTVIRADDPNNKSDEEVVLPSGHQVQIIRTTDPNSIAKGISGIPQEITLPNGQKAHLLKTTGSGANEPPPIEEIELPNGERVELIKTSDPNLVPDGVKVEPGSDLEKLVFSRTTTTIKPPKAILDELTKSVSSSNYELLKTGASGGLESIGKNLPNQKKVTFVLLEEQSDGTLKVQGVKGNDKDKTVDVDAILNKIKRGEIKLPDSPSFSTTTTKKPEVISTTLKSNFSPTLRPIHATITPNSFATDEANRYRSTVSYDTEEEEESEVPALQTNIGTQIVASSTPATYYSSSSTTSRPTKKASRTPHILNNAADLLQASSIQTAPSKNLLAPKPTEVTVEQSITPTNLFPIQETFSSVESPRSSVELPDIMKKNGLFAMAKFLKQSGLDTILNETGPYTVFVPTDKAFRTLLIQLGGPERAEEKFKDNPRLLSGLLLHHVIPGAFKISSLQDEMTGVSLAGTQLRVNQYTMHDKEWNDVKITTINGAKVLEESQDIDIPQGVAHAVDRVMFPLPVGDIVQTLQSDRERRFTSFLRAIFASGLDEMLQGSKIFTLIAPTEKAFAGLSVEDLSKLVTDKVLARELVLRHLVAGTLYTNGMRYYQIKDSLLQDRQLTFSKQSGKVKVNNNLLTTQNIPATNGVIHAVDTLL